MIQQKKDTTTVQVGCLALTVYFIVFIGWMTVCVTIGVLLIKALLKYLGS